MSRVVVEGRIEVLHRDEQRAAQGQTTRQPPMARGPTTDEEGQVWWDAGGEALDLVARDRRVAQVIAWHDGADEDDDTEQPIGAGLDRRSVGRWDLAVGGPRRLVRRCRGSR